MRIPQKGEYRYFAETGRQQQLQVLQKKLEAAENGSGILQLREKFRQYRENAEKREQNLKKTIASLENSHANELAAVRKMWQQTNEDVEAYAERQIQQLGAKHRKEVDRVYELLRAADVRNEELLEINAQLSAKVKEQEGEIRWLREQLNERDDQLGANQVQMNRNHTNSSIASSQEGVLAKNRKARNDAAQAKKTETTDDKDKNKEKTVHNSREKSGRPQGAQTGHKPQRRPELKATQKHIWVVPDKIKADEDNWVLVDYREKRLVDVYLAVECIPYRYGIYRHALTGETYKVPIPDCMHDELNYGANLKSLCLMLDVYGNMPSRKVAEFIQIASGGLLPISNGFVAGLSKEFSRKSNPERREIRRLLGAGEYMHVDGTGCDVNGEQHCISVNCNDRAVLLSYSKHKGIESLQGTPYKDFEGVGVHDREKTYDGKPSKLGDKGRPKKGHQWCLAHLLRELLSSRQNECDLKWADRMHKLLRRLCHERKEWPKDGPTQEYKMAIRKEYDDIVRLGEEEYETHPPKSYFPDGLNLLKAMRDNRECVLYFLDHPNIPHTNNVAERRLRVVKRQQASAVLFRSPSGPKNFCDVMSVLMTEKMNGRPIFTKAVEVFSR